MKTQEIFSQIFFFRGKKVILDFHLAAMYEVETRTLNQAVKRNVIRFPDDFMFQLTDKEFQCLISQNVISSYTGEIPGWGGRRKLPLAFTEQGVAMLSGILRSKKAVNVNIAIMRAFVKMRELIDENKELKKKLDEMESKYDQQFQVVFEAIRQLIGPKNKARRPIGFKLE
ncbi:MAG: ORF6N domain-containing protein [Bacteroidales bacterium]|nr:ORF6N domain-containing protein [Bacteroidales bacterium]MCF8458748.1 ORF6N domain-containing protein [Bacteroidales bacterium]